MSHVVIPLIAISSGALLHLMLYRFDEWDIEAPYVFLSHLTFWIGGSLLIYLKQSSITDLFGICITPKDVLVLGCYSTFGIYCSVILYRMFFHKLHKFPGPFLARASNFYMTAISGRKLRFYLESQRMHKIYGDYLRIGPSELSIADPRAVRAIYGSQSPVSKGPFYTMLHPQKALLTTREKEEHAERRKVWDKAFGSKALHDYEPRMLIHINRLLELIDSNLDKPVPVKEWINYLAFDVMGDIVLGKSFNTLTDKHASDLHIVSDIKTQLRVAFGYFGHLPWLFSLLKVTPLVNLGVTRFWHWIDARISETRKLGLNQPNVFSYFLQTYEAGGKTARDTFNLQGDAFGSILAGSNPIATAAINILFRLACHKDEARKLQKRLDQLPDLSYDSVSKLDLLDGVINEAFRLHSPLLSGNQRLTPPNGLYIGDKYIPGNVKVRVPLHTVYHDSRAFVSPEEFIPERWTTRPELINDHSVFIPFNIGPFACAAKQFALMELRHSIARLLKSYDISLAPLQTEKDFLSGQQDHFVLARGQTIGEMQHIRRSRLRVK